MAKDKNKTKFVYTNIDHCFCYIYSVISITQTLSREKEFKQL